MTQSIILRAEAKPLLRALSEAERFVKSGNCPLEIGNAFVDLLESPSELARVDVDIRTATGASEMVVSFNPRDRLAGLVATLSARDIYSSVVE